MDPEMITAKGDGIPINVARWKGEGAPVLCVHGLTANCRCWDTMVSALAPIHEVLAVDLRGRGRSGKPATGYSLVHHVEDLRRVLDHLALERVALMGHSLGAFISLAFAARHPERTDRLILVDGGGKLSQEQLDEVLKGITPSLERLGKVFPSEDAYLEAVRKTPYVAPWSAAIENYYRYEMEKTEGGVRCNINPAHIQEEAANIRGVEADQFYGQVSCKTLILRARHGLLSDRDIVMPEDVVARMVREIPRAFREDFDTNHFMLVFDPIPERDCVVLDFLGE